MTKTVDTIKNGKKQRVLLPDDAPVDHADKGIPVNVDLSALYPEPLCSKLEHALWDRGLVTPEDFKRGDAAELVRAALQAVLKYDTLDIIRFAIEGNTDNG